MDRRRLYEINEQYYVKILPEYIDKERLIDTHWGVFKKVDGGEDIYLKPLLKTGRKSYYELQITYNKQRKRYSYIRAMCDAFHGQAPQGNWSAVSSSNLWNPVTIQWRDYNHNKRKLTQNDFYTIYDLVITEGQQQKDVAESYNVSRTTISKIIKLIYDKMRLT